MSRPRLLAGSYVRQGRGQGFSATCSAAGDVGRGRGGAVKASSARAQARAVFSASSCSSRAAARRSSRLASATAGLACGRLAGSPGLGLDVRRRQRDAALAHRLGDVQPGRAAAQVAARPARRSRRRSRRVRASGEPSSASRGRGLCPRLRRRPDGALVALHARHAGGLRLSRFPTPRCASLPAARHLSTTCGRASQMSASGNGLSGPRRLARLTSCTSGARAWLRHPGKG